MSRAIFKEARIQVGKYSSNVFIIYTVSLSLLSKLKIEKQIPKFHFAY